jgi:hypothetical protein
MYQPLAQCTGCRRHVRTIEARCPFCGAERETAVVEPAPVLRLSRAVTFVAALAIGGCQSEPQANPIVRDPVAAKPSAAPTPAPAPSPSSSGLVDDPGSPVAEYGAPAPPHPTAHPTAPAPTKPKPKPAPGEVDDHGGMMSKYGAPPPPTSPF